MDATGPGGAVVNFDLVAEDTFDPNPSLSCDPASGSLFSGGVATVTCTATDAAGNITIATFTVTLPVTNVDPVVAADQTPVTFEEGQAASNTGTVSDPDGDTVTLTASVGTVANNGDGTWSWSFATSDGPAENQALPASTSPWS